MILFVDDEKNPEWYNLPEDTHIARTIERAVEMWETGKYDVLWLDHDMGKGWYGINDGSVYLRYICGKYKPPKRVNIISWNPSGIQRIAGVCKDYNIHWEFSNVGDASLL